MTNDPRNEDAATTLGRPARHPSKYPSGDRVAPPSAGKTPTQTLEAAVEAFDRYRLAGKFAAAEQERRQVVDLFPLADWPDLPLDRYALGTANSVNSFCRWMEFNTPNIASIKGGSALKHLIFKRKGTDEWYFEKKYETLEDAWRSVRAGFVESFRLASESRFEEIAAVDAIRNAYSLSTKAVYCYFPDEVLPVCSSAHQDHFWKLLGGEGPIEHGPSAARRLLELARGNPAFDTFRTNEIMWILYDWADPRSGQRVVKIAPGRNAELWDDCLANGYIRVGWDEIGDLRDFESRDQFSARFADTFASHYNGNAGKITEKSGEVWTLTELNPGDVIIANQGTSRVVGIGRVTDRAYEWREHLGQYCHTVAVDWEPGPPRDIDPIKRWAFKTVAPVSHAEYQQIMRGKSAGPAPSRISTPETVDPILHEIAAELSRKGQVILYGPPGTGKTYHARRFAVWWLARELGQQDAASTLVDHARFRDREEGLGNPATTRRVWWITANAKEWSWDRLFVDDTVEYRYARLRKNYANLRVGDIVVGYQANPTKRIVALARIAKTLHPTADGEKITLEPLRQVRDGPTWDELVADERLSASEPVRNRAQGTLFALTPTEGAYLISWLQERDASLVDLPDVDDDGVVGNLTRVTFHPSYTYEDFVEGFKPQQTGSGGLSLALEDGVFKRVCAAARLKPDEPFLLLIDEVNRGNIPKIFGELITLLERDKRGMTVSLPQSRDKFEVPRNVFIVGTMNTADRSIRLLDAALRRRFAFIELMPDSGPLQGAMVGSLDLGLFLDTLNDRIARTEGREKQIGHSFLLDERGFPIADPEEFAGQFRHEIVPLLQEYAYEDYRELEAYLGKAVVDVDAQRIRPGVLDDPQVLLAALANEFGQAQEVSDLAEP